jgi:CheY-like chemotaxis protein
MRNMSILVVEDSAAMRSAIMSSLRNLDANFIEIDDGALALDAYADHRPDWVLMDLQMKEVDGLVATSQIRAAYPEARIVIVTNFDDTQLRDAAREAGACGYVVKDDLLALRAIISQREQNAASTD